MTNSPSHDYTPELLFSGWHDKLSCQVEIYGDPEHEPGQNYTAKFYDASGDLVHEKTFNVFILAATYANSPWGLQDAANV